MEVFDDVTHYLMPWHTFWRHDELFSVMVCSLLQGEFVVVMMYFMTCLYCPDIFVPHFANKILSFDVMTNFLTSWYVLYFKVNLLLSWRISWPAYIVLTFLFIILRTKYYETVFLMSLTLWYIFLFYAKRLTSWQTLCHHAMFLINVLTSWQICWRDDMFLTSWRIFVTYLLTLWRVFDVIANLSMLWHVFDFMTHCFDIYLMSWQILWRHGVLLMSLTCFEVFVTSWHTFYVLTHDMFLHYDEPFCRDDVFLSLFREQNIISIWFRYYDEIFWEQNIMKTCFWCLSELFHVFEVMTSFSEVMTYFWHTFWHHNVVFLLYF